jgi:phosphatidate cytidylyltransferase
VLALHEYWLILWTGKKPVMRVPLMVFGLAAAAASVLGRMPVRFGSADNLVPFAVSMIVLGLLTWEVLTPRHCLERLANTLLGVFFVGWTLAFLINIRELFPHGEYYTYMLFLTVWSCDTAAYFAGRSFGKHKLNPEVSPKKTWEGAVAGFFAAVIISFLLRALFVPDDMPFWGALLLGAAAGVTGQISDLAESVLKRSAGVKDSSSLLPGHGGILDRFDSYLLLAPLYYYILLAVLVPNK